MLDNLLEIIAPYPCIYCKKLRAAVCENCKYNIEMIASMNCLLCHSSLLKMQCNEPGCKLFSVPQFVAAEREGVLAELLSVYKFQPARSYSRVLAGLLDDVVPILPQNACVVAVPTSRQHIRQRGFDHITLLARQFAKRRDLKAEDVLVRHHNRRQVGSSRSQRFSNASSAYSCNVALSPDKTYVLVDDVTTTGATLLYAYESLVAAGAKKVFIIALSHQALS